MEEMCSFKNQAARITMKIEEKYINYHQQRSAHRLERMTRQNTLLQIQRP